VTLALVPVCFFFIAFVFSMLGMGGSQVYIPILFWFGLDFKTQAIPLGMLLNVVNSSSAAVTYGRARLIDWRVGVLFGATMLLTAPLGTWLNLRLPTRGVIGVFALFTATAAVLMLSGWRPKVGGLGRLGRTVLGLTGGAALGFFAGLIGRGGGSFVVPLLYIAGLSPKNAAATSALAVTFSGSSSFVSHLATAARPDWLLWGACVGSVLAGSQLGSRFMARRLRSRAVKTVFGVALLIIAAVLIVKDVIMS